MDQSGEGRKENGKRREEAMSLGRVCKRREEHDDTDE